MSNVMRQDVEILDNAVGLGNLTLADAKEIAALPLVVIPEVGSNPDPYPEWSAFFDADEKHGYYPEDFFFREFAVMLGNVNKIVAHVILMSDTQVFVRFITELQGTVVGCICTPSNTADVQAHVNIKELVGFENNTNPSESTKQQIFKIAMQILFHTQSFARFNLERHRYVCSVARTGVKPPPMTSRKAVIARASGPRVIYLNRMPATAQDEQKIRHHGGDFMGTYIGQRIAYRKTLSADRFKNHPLYKVHKGVYVRDAWVGPKVAVINGHTYTILEKV